MKKLITLLLSILTCTHGHAQYIMHIAGNNSCYDIGTSNDNIPAIRATVNTPDCICRDATGNLYFGEATRVRKISAATGLVTTIAGGGTATGDNIPATTASLSSGVTGIFTDAAGDLYIADNRTRLRKVNKTTGIINTVAGYYSTTPTGYTGDGGPATAAGLYQPGGGAIDAAGYIYIADRNNHAIRKVTAATGIITTIAGTGAMAAMAARPQQQC